MKDNCATDRVDRPTRPLPRGAFRGTVNGGHRNGERDENERAG